ncbi:MAG: serine/threonine-protein kinase [Planctomycetota bacterium]
MNEKSETSEIQENETAMDSSHPSSSDLSEFAFGQLPDEKAKQIEDHLNQCDDCCRQLEDLSAGDNDFAAEIKDAMDASRKVNEIFEEQPNHTASQHIGPYKLLQQIGAGGMGQVWMAEQEKPVRRRVALKLTRAGVNSKEVIARFEAERQALAMMDHQNIAKVLDAGATTSGNPYFVMELVKGIPLIEYCDNKKLGIRERLNLFIPVCKAVQHAHQKGIIHRDLKPSNVLVALYDGVPVPKVIDFGLAKALDNSTRLTERTIFTEFGKIVGTLTYMSPEQAEMNALDVDTRTDVYSLGVMLYELLTGSTPIEEDTVRNTAFLRVLEIIRESEPPIPSIRLSSLDSAEVVSEKRSLDPQKLRKALHGELDWVVMKALEKDRNRRYDSASSLAGDLERYLQDEPVFARPASTIYQLRKFVSKNRGLVASLTGLLTLLVGGIVVSSYFAIQANESASQSDIEAKNSAEIVSVFMEAFRSTMPSREASHDMLARDVLINARNAMRRHDLDDVGRLRILDALGDAFFTLGDRALSEEIRQEQVDISSKKFPKHPATLQYRGKLAMCQLSNGNVIEATKTFEQIIAPTTELLGEGHIDTLNARSNLAICYMTQQRFDEAIELQESTIGLANKYLEKDHRLTLKLIGNLSNSLSQAGKKEEAMEIREQVLHRMNIALGEDHPDTINVLAGLAINMRENLQFTESRELLAHSIEKLKEKIGADHPDTINLMFNLAIMYSQDGMEDESKQTFKTALINSIKKHGPNHPLTKKLESYVKAAKTTPMQVNPNINNVVWQKVAKPTTGSQQPLTINELEQLRELCNESPRYAFLNTLGTAYFCFKNCEWSK